MVDRGCPTSEQMLFCSMKALDVLGILRLDRNGRGR